MGWSRFQQEGKELVGEATGELPAVEWDVVEK